MSNSAIPQDTFVGDATYIVATPDLVRLPNSTALSTLPSGTAANPDIIMVQKGGLGGTLEGVPVSSLPSGGGGGLAWNVVSVDTPMVANNGYILTATVGMTLPAASVVGDIIRVTSASKTYVIKQGANQQIFFNTNSTAIGLGGSVTAINIGESLEMVCIVDNLEWLVLSSTGNLFTLV